MLSYCGLVCNSCPILLATLEKDVSKKRSMKESISRVCFEMYDTRLQPEEIGDCDGCMTIDGRIFPGCLDCKVRNCASSKNIENCAFCDDYPCQELERLFQHNPGARYRLNEIHSLLGN